MRILFRLMAVLATLVTAGAASAQTTLKVVMLSDLKILDPIWTTAYIVRDHGYMIYDTLFALDAKLQVQPQMVDTWKVSDDKLTYTFVLRDGLKFHDGQPVTAEDCIASIKRWGARDAMGQKLMQFTKEMAVVDARTFTLWSSYRTSATWPRRRSSPRRPRRSWTTVPPRNTPSPRPRHCWITPPTGCSGAGTGGTATRDQAS